MRIHSSAETNLHEAQLQARREERDLEDRRLELLKTRLDEQLRQERQSKMQVKVSPSR